MRWDAVNARARGLATHLLRRADLLRAAAAGSWLLAARRLLDAGYPAEAAAAASPADFERAVGRIAARRTALLGRWLGDRRSVLAVIYDDEDRRTIRILLRGAAQGAVPAARLRAAVPTATLPEPSLERLARAETPARVGQILLRLGHPAGRALMAAWDRSRGGAGGVRDLYAAEVALGRLFAERSVRHGRRGGAGLRRYVACRIDLENAWSLLAAAASAAPSVADLALPGGAILTPARFVELARVAEPARRRAALAAAFRQSPLAPVFADPAAPAELLESRALAALVSWQRRRARRNPLGSGPLLQVLLAIRVEAHDLRTIVAGTTLGAPPAVIGARLATAA